jgi:hypothetical protein
MGVGGSACVAFMIFDHPHRREALLAAVCERVSAGHAPPGSLRPLAHATWVALMTLLSTVVMMFCAAFSQPFAASDWGGAALLVGLPPVLAFLCCLILEANQVAFRSSVARGMASVIGIGALTTLLVAAAIDVGYTMAVWQDCLYVAGTESRDTELKRQYPERFKVLSTREQVDTARRLHNQWPVLFFLTYQPLTSTVYLGLFAAFIAGLWYWRWRAYRGIRREAEQAVRGRDQPEQVAKPPHAVRPAAT